MHPISVTIIALNEQDRIGDAIASVEWAAEVIVVDSGSSDETVAIAERAGARAEHADWPGYGRQKNRAAALAANRWVLSLDADERVSPGLADEIQRIELAGAEVAFELRRRNRVTGAPLRHWPWAWDRTARLYDKERARFSEVPVHESLQVNGAVGRLQGVLEHETYRNWDDYYCRQKRYAALGARAAYEHGVRPIIGDQYLRPAVTFIRQFLIRGHLLSGRLGFRYSLESARGTRQKLRLLQELWESRSGSE
jgi:glycosyltransferase involved in cell wall biosynthesis